MSHEDRKLTWNSRVQKAIRRGSVEGEVRKHRDRCPETLYGGRSGRTLKQSHGGLSGKRSLSNGLRLFVNSVIKFEQVGFPAKHCTSSYGDVKATSIHIESVDLKGKIYQRASLVLTCDQSEYTCYRKQEHS